MSQSVIHSDSMDSIHPGSRREASILCPKVDHASRKPTANTNVEANQAPFSSRIMHITDHTIRVRTRWSQRSSRISSRIKWPCSKPQWYANTIANDSASNAAERTSSSADIHRQASGTNSVSSSSTAIPSSSDRPSAYDFDSWQL